MGRGQPPATRTTTASPATTVMGRSPGQTRTLLIPRGPSTLAAGACPWSVCLSVWWLCRREDVSDIIVNNWGADRGWGVVGARESDRSLNRGVTL